LESWRGEEACRSGTSHHSTFLITNQEGQDRTWQ